MTKIKNMFISIVTLNYKKKELTLRCMKSLCEQFGKEFKDGKIELIIVDNASGDDSVESINHEIKKEKYENMHLVANSENSGFGAGCNLGVSKSKGEFILFLNNDTIVIDHGIVKMAEYMRDHQDVAILGGQLRNFDGSLQASAGKFYTLSKALLLLLGMQRFGLLDRSPRKIEQVDWVKGGLLMIRRDVFDKLGGFDEKIFMYTEDMELCYRAHLVGYKIHFYPDVQVLHADQGSSNRTFAIINIYKNLLYFYKKHKSYPEYLILKFILRTKAVMLIGLGRVLNKPYLTDTYQRALAAI